MNTLTNFEFVVEHVKSEKKPEQIIEEFRMFCSNQRECDSCPFEQMCSSLTVTEMNEWLVQDFNKPDNFKK